MGVSMMLLVLLDQCLHAEHSNDCLRPVQSMLPTSRIRLVRNR